MCVKKAEYYIIDHFTTKDLGLTLADGLKYHYT